jgi:hypothetical protein
VTQFLREIDELDRPAVTAKFKAVLSALFTAAAADTRTTTP